MTRTDPTSRPERTWWKEAVVYQIYPRSFNDTDGDGVGDIPGIVERADYLDALGVDVVWLCPVYDSPNRDNGYDIRDYRSILDQFGTMADWEALRSELHARDVRLVMDLVVNHTSADHEWFQRSRRREAGYEDHYHWVDGDPSEPPNDWKSVFGGPAWTYDEERGQWYLHLFDKTQPDLNWRNPDVRADVKEVIEWWLERGIDGFRMDAITMISKPEGYPDVGDGSDAGKPYLDGPRVVEYLREVSDDVLAEYDALAIGETPGVDVDRAGAYLADDGAGLDVANHFDHVQVDAGPDGRWDPEGWGEWSLPEFKRILTRWQTELPEEGRSAIYLGNHDQPRAVSRFGDDGRYREESATLIATFLLTARGVPFVYQGDEIGMTNVEFESFDDLDDVETIGAVEDLIERGVVDSFEDVLGLVNYTSRDHARTPMQWSAEDNAGFTDGEPWFPVTDNYREINVEAARAAPDSIWHYHRRLIDLRHEEDALVYGEYELLLPDHERIYAYTRTLGDETVLVVLNWSDEPSVFEGATVATADAEPIVGNYGTAPADPGGHEFRPYEAAVYRL